MLSRKKINKLNQEKKINCSLVKMKEDFNQKKRETKDQSETQLWNI